MTRKKIWWALILLWFVFIFFQSAKPAVESSQESSAVLNAVNHLIAFFLGQDKLVLSENLIRKSGHFIEYFILGTLLFQGIKGKRKLAGTFCIAWLVGTLYAITDEIHQHFVPGRSMRAFDVCIDSAGLLLGSLLLLWTAKKRETNVENKNKNLYNV